MTFINKLLGVNLNDNTMTKTENVNIEERLKKIESHLLSLNRSRRKNQRVVKGVLMATGIITFSILAIWIIWTYPFFVDAELS